MHGRPSGDEWDDALNALTLAARQENQQAMTSARLHLEHLRERFIPATGSTETEVEALRAQAERDTATIRRLNAQRNALQTEAADNMARAERAEADVEAHLQAAVAAKEEALEADAWRENAERDREDAEYVSRCNKASAEGKQTLLNEALVRAHTLREALAALVEWATGRDVHGRNEKPEACGYCDALARARAALDGRPDPFPRFLATFHAPVTITDTGTGRAHTVERPPCTCVVGPSSVVPSPSCPQHGHGPIPGRRG